MEEIRQKEIEILSNHIEYNFLLGDVSMLANALYDIGYRRLGATVVKGGKPREYAEACSLEEWRSMDRGIGKGVVQATENYLFVECDGHKWQLSKPLMGVALIGEELEFEKAWSGGQLGGHLFAYAPCKC